MDIYVVLISRSENKNDNPEMLETTRQACVYIKSILKRPELYRIVVAKGQSIEFSRTE